MVVFNATPAATTQTVAGARRAALPRCIRCRRPAATRSSSGAAYAGGAGAFTVPARTVAVFVSDRGRGR